jgi:hypothetical protein
VKKEMKLAKSFAMRAVGLTALWVGMFPSHAGTISNGVIVQLGFDNGAPDVLFISVDGSKSPSTACSTNTSWDYVLPLNSEQGKRMYVMLLAARTAGTPVTLVGSSACPTTDIETLHAVYY